MSDELKDLIDSAVPIEDEIALRLDLLGEQLAEQAEMSEDIRIMSEDIVARLLAVDGLGEE